MSNEIVHYGIKRRSGRYPWGSGDRPFQGLGSSASKKLKKLQEYAKSRSSSSSKTSSTSSTGNKSSTEEIKERQKKLHDELLKSTDAKKLYKYRNLLTDAELRSRLNRLQNEEQLRQFSSKQLTKQQRLVKKVTKTYKDVEKFMRSPQGQKLIKMVQQKAAVQKQQQAQQQQKKKNNQSKGNNQSK